MSKKRKASIVLFALVVLGFLVPERKIIPVRGASVSDWHKDTFWYEPWGSSGVHKGIDIFAEEGEAVIASSAGLVLFQGEIEKGGNVVLVLSGKWRLHYYSHLASIHVRKFQFVASAATLGTVGSTGNAKGKAPHLHYSVLTLIPYPWRATAESQGYKKMMYLDPGKLLREGRQSDI